MEQSDYDKLLDRYEALRRDFIDLAQALGVNTSFQAVAQRVAELLDKERKALSVDELSYVASKSEP